MLQAVTGHALVLEEEQTALKSEHSRAKGEALVVNTAGNAARTEALTQLQVYSMIVTATANHIVGNSRCQCCVHVISSSTCSGFSASLSCRVFTNCCLCCYARTLCAYESACYIAHMNCHF
jgi:hypothetical protein